MRSLLRLVAAVEAVCSTAAALTLFAIMAIVAADVVMRYVVNHPFGWSYDLVALYLVLAAFYLALSRTFSGHAHVGVDILHYYVGPRVRRIFNAIVCLVSAPLFACVTWEGALRAWESWRGGDVMAGAIAWPTWAAFVLVPIGAGLLTLRLVLDLAAHVATLLGGPDYLPLPALARSAEGAPGEGGFE